MELSNLRNRFQQTNSKLIIVTGGVCSSIGKGALVASIGVLLKKADYSVSVVKWDPYLNVDPGTMSPLVHGEVFVTQDGAETDLDLGHYERHIGLSLTRDSSVSSGQVYQEVLDGERTGRFLGKCIQLVPHVVDVIKSRLLSFVLSKGVEFVLVEIGGTVGDMEGEVFLEAIRQLRMEVGSKQIMHIHLSYVPFLSWTGEVKTKPTQHSVTELKRAGLAPDCLCLRADKSVDDQSLDKLSIMCEVKRNYIFQALTFDPMYRMFLDLDRQGLCTRIQEHFQIQNARQADLSEWQKFIEMIDNSTKTLSIGLIAKYVGTNDPYISVIEAIKSAAYHHKMTANIVVIEAELLEQGAQSVAWQQLQSLDGIVVPGGFDKRGIEGKILAARWARENNVPYFGLCLGMQIMVIEAARSLLGLPDATSTEFEADTKAPVICLMGEQREITKKGASMRLGSYLCNLVSGTKAFKAYNQDVVRERHRHRYEVNNSYREQLEKVGVVFSGIYEEKDLVEIAEHRDHLFMLGTQFHPEFQSSPLKVHPLFNAFIQAAIARKNKH